MWKKLNKKSTEYVISKISFGYMEGYRELINTLSEEDLFFLKNDLEKDIRSANEFIDERIDYVNGIVKNLTGNYSNTFANFSLSASFKEKNNARKFTRDILQVLLNKPDVEHFQLCRSISYSFWANLLKEDGFRFQANKTFEKLRLQLQNTNLEQIDATIKNFFENYKETPLIFKMLTQGVVSEMDVYDFCRDIITILAETKTPLETN